MAISSERKDATIKMLEGLVRDVEAASANPTKASISAAFLEGCLPELLADGSQAGGDTEQWIGQLNKIKSRLESALAANGK